MTFLESQNQYNLGTVVSHINNSFENRLKVKSFCPLALFKISILKSCTYFKNMFENNPFVWNT